LTLLAGNLFGFAVSATVEVDVTTGRNGELTEGKLAVGRQVGRNQFVDAVAAVGVPVIFAVVVNASLAVKEQTILASLQSQGAIFALVKLVAVLRVGIQLKTVRLGARADLAVSRTGCLRSANITTGYERDESDSNKEKNLHG